MAAPAVAQVATDLYDELGHTQPADEALGWPFLLYLNAAAIALGELPDIVRDSDDHVGWSAVLDPARCPVYALPWLAQFAGVRLTPGATEEQHRAEITAPPAFQRGTPAAMRAAATLTLTGTARVRITERDGSPYALSVRTYESETPDPVEAERLIRSQKPAGLVLTYDLAMGWDWSELVAWNATENGGTWAGLVADTETDTWTEVAHHLDA